LYSTQNHAIKCMLFFLQFAQTCIKLVWQLYCKGSSHMGDKMSNREKTTCDGRRWFHVGLLFITERAKCGNLQRSFILYVHCTAITQYTLFYGMFLWLEVHELNLFTITPGQKLSLLSKFERHNYAHDRNVYTGCLFTYNCVHNCRGILASCPCRCVMTHRSAVWVSVSTAPEILNLQTSSVYQVRNSYTERYLTASSVLSPLTR